MTIKCVFDKATQSVFKRISDRSESDYIDPVPTCLDGVFEGGAAADQDVVQGCGFVLQLPVVHLQQLVRVVKIDHLRFPIERFDDVGQ